MTPLQTLNERLAKLAHDITVQSMLTMLVELDAEVRQHHPDVDIKQLSCATRWRDRAALSIEELPKEHRQFFELWAEAVVAEMVAYAQDKTQVCEHDFQVVSDLADQWMMVCRKCGAREHDILSEM